MKRESFTALQSDLDLKTDMILYATRMRLSKEEIRKCTVTSRTLLIHATGDINFVTQRMI